MISEGRVAQFGQPYELLCEEEGGILADLVNETGQATSERLREIARTAYFTTINTSGNSDSEFRTKL